MNCYPGPVIQLIRQLTQLPGIGEKTAERLALHILHGSRRDAESLAHAVLLVKEKVRLCGRCFALSDADLCAICRNPARDAAVLCVVESMSEMVAIEKSGGFTGRYHLLQGVLSPMEGVGPDDLRIRELLERIPAEQVVEVILATGTGVEGESTAAYVASRLKPLGVRITRIAAGVPMGGDLKYVDQMTIKRALDSRHALG